MAGVLNPNQGKTIGDMSSAELLRLIQTHVTNNQQAQIQQVKSSIPGGPVGVTASISTTQTLGSGTWTTVSFDQVSHQDVGWFNSSAHTITPNETGWYSVLVQVYFTGSTAGCILGLSFYNLTLSADVLLQSQNTDGTSGAQINASGPVYLQGGHSFVARAYQSSGVNQTISTSDCAFTVVKM